MAGIDDGEGDGSDDDKRDEHLKPLKVPRVRDFEAKYMKPNAKDAAERNPYWCLKCDMEVTFVNGSTGRRQHFRHFEYDASPCIDKRDPREGERSVDTEADERDAKYMDEARRLLCENIRMFIFIARPRRCGHPIETDDVTFPDSFASTSARVGRSAKYRMDCGVFKTDEPETVFAAIDVKHQCRRISSDKREYMLDWLDGRYYEIEASAILRAVRKKRRRILYDIPVACGGCARGDPPQAEAKDPPKREFKRLKRMGAADSDDDDPMPSADVKPVADQIDFAKEYAIQKIQIDALILENTRLKKEGVAKEDARLKKEGVAKEDARLRAIQEKSDAECALWEDEWNRARKLKLSPAKE